MNTKRPKIAVIGAGWAGLSAAVSLIHRADISCLRPGDRQAVGRVPCLGKMMDSAFWIMGSISYWVRIMVFKLDATYWRST